MRYFILVFILIFTSCSKPKEESIKIATNVWIGYTPLFMAKKLGKLKPLNIELLHNVSLAEAMEVFSVGKADMVTTTQHEYFLLKEDFDIKPVILIDRSYGGDMILSNHSLEDILKSDKIDAYLEIDSINNELLKSFIKKYNIPLDKINLHNMDQRQIQALKNDKSEVMLIVTYAPYHQTLLPKGFNIVASTKKLDTLMVIDALCAKSEIIKKDKKRLILLKTIIDEMIDIINKNPKRAYLLSKEFLENISYEEFLDSLRLIKWINKSDDELLKKINQIGYDISKIIR